MRVRSTDISARTIGDETIVLNLPSSRYFTITGVGTRVFELLAEDTSLDALVETILEEYEVDPAIARRDVQAFVDRLRDAELLG
ncbi:MAG: PqqD family protein [Pseudonocardiaceae bacterium]